MTDHEILEKYRETIKKGAHKVCQKNQIEDAMLKERILQNYQKGFLEGFKGVREEETQNIARNLLQAGMQVEGVSEATGLSIDVIASLNKDEKSR